MKLLICLVASALVIQLAGCVTEETPKKEADTTEESAAPKESIAVPQPTYIDTHPQKRRRPRPSENISPAVANYGDELNEYEKSAINESWPQRRRDSQANRDWVFGGFLPEK